MEGKVALARSGIAPRDRDRLLGLLAWEHECRSHAVGARGEGSSDRLGIWYSEQTLSQLRFLWGVVEGQQGDLQATLKLLFSDLLFACASSGGARTSSGGTRRHHWGWVADNVRPQVLIEHNAVAGFRDRILFAANLERFEGEAPEVRHEDARELATESHSADLIITSPPYIGVIDYVHANRLVYEWMNWSICDERDGEIGARYKRERKHIKEEYLHDMCLCWSEMVRILRPGGFCAVIIGASSKFPTVVETAMSQLATKLQLVEGPIDRRPSRRRVSDRRAQPVTESIYVFRNLC